MSADSRYTRAHVQACRAELDAQVAAYRDLIAAASRASGMSLTRIDAAFAAFEPGYFNNLLIALEARFVHHLRDANTSPKSCSPIDEVRLIVASLIAHGGVMTADDAIAYDADKAVIRLELGDRIALNAEDFETLSAAFFAEIEAKYPG